MPFKDDLDDFTNSPLDDKEDAVEGEAEGEDFSLDYLVDFLFIYFDLFYFILFFPVHIFQYNIPMGEMGINKAINEAICPFTKSLKEKISTTAQ